MSVIAEQTGLTGKQQIFIDTYLSNGFNAADAARTAGYQGNAKQLSVIGNQNLNKLSIRQAIAARTQRAAVKADKRVINVYAEFEKNLEFVGKLRDAATKWLVDPEDAEVFTVDPRADEIDVVYIDNSGEKPVEKRASLAELLERVEGRCYNPTPFVKTVDLRDYALKVVDRLDTTVDKFAKIEGIYTREKENPNDIPTLAKVVTAYRERMEREAAIYEATGGKFHQPMPSDEDMRAEIERLCKSQRTDYAVVERYLLASEAVN